MVVCHCLRVNDELISELARRNETTVDDIVAGCGAGGRCGGCRQTIEWLLDRARDMKATDLVAG
jgi:bacterioferritin-associated ferredoxin